MDLIDPLINTLRNLPKVPIDRGFKDEDVNSKERQSADFEPEINSVDENEETGISEKKVLEIKLKVAESTGAMESDKVRDFARFDDLFGGNLPRTLLYLNRKSSRLRAFKTFDELSELIETADEHSSTSVNRVIERLQSAPARRLVHYTTLGKYLRYLYKEDMLMDVHIDVHGTSFMAHRIALCCHSGYFQNLLIKDKKRVKLPIQVKVFGVSVEAFAAFIEFIYTGKIHVNSGIVIDIIYISEYLDVKSLRDHLYSVIGSLTLEQAIKLLLRPCDPSRKLYCIAFTMIVNQFNSASIITGFLDLTVEIFCSILQSDDLRVSREYEVFQVALRWIVHGGSGRVQYISRVMDNIRFCHMIEEELFDCLEETNLFLDNTHLRDLILVANWILTSMRLNKPDPFNFPVPPRRTSYSQGHQTITQERCHLPPYSTRENDTSATRSPIESSHGALSSSKQFSKSSAKQGHPGGEYTCTSNSKSRSTRYGKPVMVYVDSCGESCTKWQVQPVLTPPGYLENVVEHSPKFGKPVILPPELQLPVKYCTASTPETNNVQHTTASSSENTKVDSWTQTPSKESSPNRSVASANPGSCHPGDTSLNELQKVFSPDVEANISNHSPRYVKSLLLPPRDDDTGAQSSQETTGLSEGIIQRPAISQICHCKPTEWSPDTSKEHTSSVQARPLVLPPEENQNSYYPDMQTVQRLAVSHESHKRPSLELTCSKESTLRHSATYPNHELLPTSKIQTPKIVSRSSTFLTTHETKAGWSPDTQDELTPKYCHNQQDKTPQTRQPSVPLDEKKVVPDMSKVTTTSSDIIVVGYVEENKLSDKVKNGGKEIAFEFCKLPEARQAFAVARVGRKVYVIGGHSVKESKSEQKVTKTVLQKDCFDKEWVQVASMNEARMSHSACVLNDNIYVFGGLDEYDSPLASCEYYSPGMNTWTAITTMPLPVYGATAAALGGKCYVAGGMTHNTDNRMPRLRMTMIRYDPKNGKWSMSGYLRMPLCHASLVNVQGRLLLCGGATFQDDTAIRRKLVSVATIYEYNILTNTWCFRTKMSSARQEGSAVAVGSKLYVVGGKSDADDNIVQSVECYDTNTSSWEDCKIEIPPTVQDIKCLSCQNIK